jgi:hypothetical protein
MIEILELWQLAMDQLKGTLDVEINDLIQDNWELIDSVFEVE